MAVTVDKEKCTACASCVDVCPNSAITVPGEVAEVKNEECIDCGACVDACTQQALALE